MKLLTWMDNECLFMVIQDPEGNAREEITVSRAFLENQEYRRVGLEVRFDEDGVAVFFTFNGTVYSTTQISLALAGYYENPEVFPPAMCK